MLMAESMWGQERYLIAMEKSMRRRAVWVGGSDYQEEASLVIFGSK